MTKIDIISGFLGAGKTTLIKKLLEEAFIEEKVVLIENEFGEVGIDGALFKDYKIQITEMNSGCICCSIAGDFGAALKEILALDTADRIIIEPSGVGKLSDVINGCQNALKGAAAQLNMCVTVVDATKYKVYVKNFTEFYTNQLANAKAIILSRSQKVNEDTIEMIIKDLRRINPHAQIISTDWQELDGSKIKEIGELTDNVEALHSLINPTKHTHASHHHTDEVFSVWGRETAKTFERNKIESVLKQLKHLEGTILRAKGIIKVEKNQWLQFDYVPDETFIKDIKPDYIGRICVIGEQINDVQITELFGL
ncbi:CobW family GTP-binding protein [Acetobacterium carbinolicum]|uniref:CobW family GTP-binding protein n=1 Tax=Acetobacterium carbinolicum TaxID=52690 RepID=UPI0039BF4725